MVASGPTPGSTPTAVPKKAPMKQNNRLIGCRAVVIPSERLPRRSIVQGLSQGPKAGAGIWRRFRKRPVQSAVRLTVSPSAKRHVIARLPQAATSVVSAMAGTKPRGAMASANTRGAPRMQMSDRGPTNPSIVTVRPTARTMMRIAARAKPARDHDGKEPGAHARGRAQPQAHQAVDGEEPGRRQQQDSRHQVPHVDPHARGTALDPHGLSLSETGRSAVSLALSRLPDRGRGG